MRFSVAVPASSANLGPGFDSLAVALTRHLRVQVEPGNGESTNSQAAEIAGEGDLVLQAMQHVATHVGEKLPPVCVHVESEIPVARGMGSSAAALLGGMIAGNRLTGEQLTCEDILTLSTAIEGHADNLAAALYGGVSLAIPVDTGQDVVQLGLNMDIKAVIFIPDKAALTRDARAAIPTQIPREDAVFNASRCALLVHAFATGETSLLREAMRDRIHQPYRSSLYPHLNAVIASAMQAGACGSSLSGSGPSVLALAKVDSANAVAEAMKLAGSANGVHGRCLELDIDRTGVQVHSW
jgi:homoserine kinase